LGNFSSQAIPAINIHWHQAPPTPMATNSKTPSVYRMGKSVPIIIPQEMHNFLALPGVIYTCQPGFPKTQFRYLLDTDSKN